MIATNYALQPGLGVATPHQAFTGMPSFGAPVNGANPLVNDLLSSVGSLPTGLTGNGNAAFSPGSNPGFGGSDAMTQQFEQAMAMMTALLGAQLGTQVGGASAQGGSDSGASAGSDSSVASAAPASSSGAAPSQAASTGGAAPSNDTTDKGEIQSYIAQAAQAYGADPKVLTEMARRESSFKTEVVNDWDSNAKKGTPSKGLFQFIEPTFKSYAAKAKAANPSAWEGLGELNWNDWRQQSLTAAWAVANGHGKAWSTYAASGGR